MCHGHLGCARSRAGRPWHIKMSHYRTSVSLALGMTGWYTSLTLFYEPPGNLYDYFSLQPSVISLGRLQSGECRNHERELGSLARLWPRSDGPGFVVLFETFHPVGAV